MNSLIEKHTPFEEEMMDIISSPTNNSEHLSGDDQTPPKNMNNMFDDAECSSVSSKRIRKKRNTYQKIDDEVRLQLLEAVQNGETLKAVAKRCHINYSSAKSILHTYRKEGRILKKSGQEKPFEVPQTNLFSNVPMQMPNIQPSFNHSLSQEPNGNFKPSPIIPQQNFHPLNFNKMEFNPQVKPTPNYGFQNMNLNMNMNRPMMNSSPELMSSFMSMLKMGANNMQSSEESIRMRPHQGMGGPSSLHHQNSKIEEFNLPSFPNSNFQPMASGNMNMSPVEGQSVSQMLHPNPLEKLKTFDNFYMNYSNSPLSGGGRLTDHTDSSKNNNAIPKEFESFSDMVTALQGVPRQSEEIQVPHALRFNTAQMMQEKIEAQMNSKDDATWSNTLESSTMETFKTYYDAQFMMHDALKKASYLGNLVSMQKGKGEGSLFSKQVLNSKVS